LSVAGRGIIIRRAPGGIDLTGWKIKFFSYAPLMKKVATPSCKQHEVCEAEKKRFRVLETSRLAPIYRFTTTR
ncbi:hypothetical protein, partial [Pluralibacter gergoviae]|uniref:hypothetical protein n=1 Tax=Pluralibacter gergoviae TaxID=61647 RepID=UPI001E4212F6